MNAQEKTEAGIRRVRAVIVIEQENDDDAAALATAYAAGAFTIEDLIGCQNGTTDTLAVRFTDIPNVDSL